MLAGHLVSICSWKVGEVVELRRHGSALLLALAPFALTPAAAQTVADFYRGKTVTISVGLSAGGLRPARPRAGEVSRQAPARRTRGRGQECAGRRRSHAGERPLLFDCARRH